MILPDNQVTLPVTWNTAVSHLQRTFVNTQHIGDDSALVSIALSSLSTTFTLTELLDELLS
jgi:hypothetical protein